MGEGEGGAGQRRPSITPIPTLPPQGGRRFRVVDPIAKRIFAEGAGFLPSPKRMIELRIALGFEKFKEEMVPFIYGREF
jgi:hypothetical protein